MGTHISSRLMHTCGVYTANSAVPCPSAVATVNTLCVVCVDFRSQTSADRRSILSPCRTHGVVVWELRLAHPMTSLLISALFQLTVLASAHGHSLKVAGRLGTCAYPPICQDDCKQNVGHTHCPASSQDCPCIIKACWTLNGSCIHACDETLLEVCLACLNSPADNMCQAECSRVCVDAQCEHSQGQCQGCVPGIYGLSCGQGCSSACNGSCYRDTGYCKHCQQRTHGTACQHSCPDHCHTCSAQNGSCLRCAAGYTGGHCNTPCAAGVYGSRCDRACPKHCAKTCHHVSGSCIGGCKPGYYRADCMKTCPPGTYGQDCASECAVTCAETMVCHHINGSCSHGCSSGFRGQQCGLLCSLGTYGPNCSRNCSENCLFGVCNGFSGHCQRCHDGRAGLFCEYITHVGHSSNDVNDDSMSTDQTILIFLGLFAMGGAMWFLLGTFVYYKQKIIMKKCQETGQLPKDWTSILRHYPQYFYNPRLLSRSTDWRAEAGPVFPARTLQRTERKRVKLNLNAGHEFKRQLQQRPLRSFQVEGQKKEVPVDGLRKKVHAERQNDNIQMKWMGKNVHMDGRKKHVEMEANGMSVEMEAHDMGVEMEGQGNTAETDRQRQSHTAETDRQRQGHAAETDRQRQGHAAETDRQSHAAESIENSLAPTKNTSEGKAYSVVKTRRQSFSQLYSQDLWPDRNRGVERAGLTSARGQVYVGKRSLDDGELSAMFELEEDPAHDHVEETHGTVGKVASAGDKAESTSSATAVLFRANPSTTMEGVSDGAGDTKSSRQLELSVSTTTGLESRRLQVPLGETRSPYIAQSEALAHQMPHKGISLPSDEQNTRRAPQQEKKSDVGGAHTSSPTTACPVCGKQCVCSLECQCSVVSTATTQEGRLPAVVLRRAKSSVLEGNISKAASPRPIEHGLSHTSSTYSIMKQAAVHSREPRRDRGLCKPPRPLAPASLARDQRLSTSRQTLESSLGAPRTETSLAGDTAGELSQSGTSTSGSTTHQTSRARTGASTGASDSEATDSMSTTIESSAITETSGESASSVEASLSERQHRYFKAALERQSQPYTAKTDMVQQIDEENPPAGVPPPQRNWLHVEKSQYDYKHNKPLGFIQRSIRNVVGTFNKLMGGVEQPHEVMSTRADAANAYRNFGPNETLSPQFLIQVRESQRLERDASVQPQANVTKTTTKRQKRASSRTDKVSAAADKEGASADVTERSSAMSNTASASSGSEKEDSTLTDASEIEYSTVSSSREESASTTLRSYEASSTAASSSSGTTQDSTDKHTTTDVESLSAATRSTAQHKTGPKYRQEPVTRRQSSHSRTHRPNK